jgi:hypothetical protein
MVIQSILRDGFKDKKFHGDSGFCISLPKLKGFEDSYSFDGSKPLDVVVSKGPSGWPQEMYVWYDTAFFSVTAQYATLGEYDTANKRALITPDPNSNYGYFQINIKPTTAQPESGATVTIGDQPPGEF